VIDMNEAQVRSVQQVRQVMQGVQALEFRATGNDQDRCLWIEAVLRRLNYRALARVDRGAVLAYLQRLSGYSRAQVTRLVSRWVLDKLRIEFTRSRAHRSNDNALAESKNGAVIGKLFGYEHIAQRHAARFNTFCVQYLNPFLNLHRPCLFVTEVHDAAKPGRIKRVYRAKDAMTPLDKLSSLAQAHKYLRQGVTLEHLHQLARALTDVQAGQELSQARAALFRRVSSRV